MRGSVKAYVAALVAFTALANFASSEASYAMLAVASGFFLAGKWRGCRLPSPGLTVLALLLPAASQAPLAASSTPAGRSPAAYTFAVAAAVTEELFFRGVLLSALGLPLQAFAFALAHLRLTDPVSLVESALLVPHFFLLGLAFGSVAERGGFPLSAASHAVYNLISYLYLLPFNFESVLALTLCDAAAALTLVAVNRGILPAIR